MKKQHLRNNTENQNEVQNPTNQTKTQNNKRQVKLHSDERERNQPALTRVSRSRSHPGETETTVMRS